MHRSRHPDTFTKLEARILTLLCACVLAGILVAGLWPFFPPKNDVRWLKNQNGLRFGDYATIVSTGALNLSTEKPGCSLEIWLQPGLTIDSNTILDVYSRQMPFQFRMRQSGDDLELLRHYSNDSDRKNGDKLYVDHVFDKARSTLIAVTGNAQNTSVYIDGQLTKSSQDFGFISSDLRGKLILGAAPVTDDRWSGTLMGLAIYSESLTPEQVMADYRDWSQSERLFAVSSTGTAALYLFSERSGNMVHTEIGGGPDLNIPARFRVEGQAFLTPPWLEYAPGWSYYKYNLINIVGFVPLGLFFYARFWRLGRERSAVLKTMVVGAATTLTIEILQAFIPTRQSGTTDLITNTLGTALGIVLFRCAPVQRWTRRLIASFRNELGVPEKVTEPNEMDSEPALYS
jgi:hypothetical protein